MAAAVAALAAQEHARRMQEVAERFRRAGATSPARARSLADLQVTRTDAVEALERAGVLVRGPTADGWYLDEAVAAARGAEEAEAARRRPLATLIAIVLGVLVALAFAWYVRR